MPAAELLARGCNLDVKNPNAAEDLEHQPPEKLAADILAKEQRIIEIMREIQQLLARGPKMSKWPIVSYVQVLRPRGPGRCALADTYRLSECRGAG